MRIFFDKYINECVYPEDRLMMQEALQFDNVMETFPGKKNIKEITVLSKKAKYSIISSGLSEMKNQGSSFLDF